MKMAVCGWCGVDFEKNRVWQKYCHDRHKKYAYEFRRDLADMLPRSLGHPGTYTPAQLKALRKYGPRFKYH